METDCKYHKLGFTSTKMTASDLEWCLDRGFTRCGTYIYQRTSKNSCCEVWQYRVEINEFKINKSQKQVIRRFHNYLNYGDIHGEKIQEDKEDVDIEAKTNMEEFEQIITKVKGCLEEVYMFKFVFPNLDFGEAP